MKSNNTLALYRLVYYYCYYFLYPGSKGSRGLKTKVENKNQVAGVGVALVHFGRNCKGSFRGYRVVALDRQ